MKIKKRCLFCSNKIKKRIIAENEFAFAIYDLDPVTKYHCLIITKRHINNFFKVKKNEITSIFEIIKKLQNIIKIKDKKIKGFNLGSNSGKVSGQTILHLHFHLIPRRVNDYDLRRKKDFFWINKKYIN